jgi:hypothetical protein
MNKLNYLFLNLLLFFSFLNTKAQIDIDYEISANLNLNDETVIVSQIIKYKNIRTEKTNELFLYDWSNSYKNTKTPLSNRLAEEYNRSFYLSSKSKRGFTKINEISRNNNSLVWIREKNHPDIIKVFLPEYISLNEDVLINLKYSIKLPDQKFTGFGLKNNTSINLRYWHISLAPFINKNWILNSNLDIDDNSSLSSNFKIKWDYPSNFNLASNLNKLNVEYKKDRLINEFEGQGQVRAQFIFNKEKKIKLNKLDNEKILLTDLHHKYIDSIQLKKSQKRIDSFVSSLIKPFPHKKILVLKMDYDKNPFYGLNQLPKFLNVYSDKFFYEIRFLKAYLNNYLNELLIIDKRKNHWIINGLKTYIMIKFVETFYPDENLLGEFSDDFLLKPFKLSELKFNDGYEFFYEFSQRSNLQQPDILSKDKLIKFNEKIASPYHVGIGLNYIEKNIGKKNFNKHLKEYFSNTPIKEFEPFLLKKTKQKTKWFFNEYLKDRRAYDLKIKNVVLDKESISFRIEEKSRRSLPVKIGLIKNDSVIYKKWITLKNIDTIIKLKRLNADYVSLNPEINFPESNKKNNWKFIKSSSRIKPFKFTFLKDIEDPKKNQIFYTPIINFNNKYDGISMGMRLFNKKIKSQKFTIDTYPEYSFNENSWVGSFKSTIKFYNDYNDNYLTHFQIFGSSYHYNSSLRYTVFVPSLSWVFRTPDLRSNKRQLLNVSWFNVYREKDINIKTDPDYSILNLRYDYLNKGAIKYFTSRSSLELSKNFGKVIFENNFRKLFPSGRQLEIRFFAGKFLWYDYFKKDNFFDFNLNRITDYLFQYNYLGRSEKTGFYSQQYIPAEGGFKSKFDQSNVNDYMISINLYVGIWKWIELYADIGLVKNKYAKLKGYYDSGFRINLVPDYLELFFPITSSNGFEISQNKYSSKLRFVILFEPRTLTSLLTRKWF